MLLYISTVIYRLLFYHNERGLSSVFLLHSKKICGRIGKKVGDSMKRTKVTVDFEAYPKEIGDLLKGALVYDSSCSPAARVLFVDRDRGYFVKEASCGALLKEAELASFFASKGLSSKVLFYSTETEKDYLVTERVPGEDAAFAAYLEKPEKLCEVLADSMRMLHDTDIRNCPVPDRMKDYFATVDERYHKGMFDPSIYGDRAFFKNADEAWQTVQAYKHLFQSNTLIHGDFCLPNIMLDNFALSGFIDLGNGGVGDRHVDLFWCAWSLWYNLKTDKYTDRLFDAYGREKINKDILRAVYAAEAFG